MAEHYRELWPQFPSMSSMAGRDHLAVSHAIRQGSMPSEANHTVVVVLLDAMIVQSRTEVSKC